MSIQQSIQHYTPLDEKELKEVGKMLKGSKLAVRVVSQLRQQQHYLDLQHDYMYRRNTSVADQLRDLADSVEELEAHECNEYD